MLPLSTDVRHFTTYAPLETELHLDPNQNILFDLGYLGALSVTGDNSAQFLQGQLSCDTHVITTKRMQQGALCNLKGRILALLDVVLWPTGSTFQLVLPNDLLSQTQTSLEKAALLSRVTLTPTTKIRCFGFYLQNPGDKTPFQKSLPKAQYDVHADETACCYNLGNNKYMLLVDLLHTHTLCDPFLENGQYRGSLSWHALRLQDHHVEIYSESRGLFLPHRLGLQHRGYLNFQKGCYKGQEIIARTHYRAKEKHALRLFTIQTNQSLAFGQRLLDPTTQQEVGEIIDYCPFGHTKLLIAASLVLDPPDSFLLEEDLYKASYLIEQPQSQHTF